MMTGATPHTAWLDGCVSLDGKGFVKAGRGSDRRRPPHQRSLTAAPVFCSRTACLACSRSATSSPASNGSRRPFGEGFVVVSLVHKVLAE